MPCTNLLPKTNHSPNARREKEVLEEIALGHTIQAIAERLFISEHTVISHRKNLFSKFGVHNAASLVVKAKEEGVI